MNILPFLTRSHHFLSHAILISESSAVSAPTLILKQPVPLLPFFVHSKLDYCNSLYYNFPKSQINRLQQIQNCLARTVVSGYWLKLLNLIISHPSLFLRSLQWLKINERIVHIIITGCAVAQALC